MKSRSTKIWFSSRFAFFEQEEVGRFFFGQYPDDGIEKTNVSIFVDECTVMFFIGVFQGNAKKKLRNLLCWKNYCPLHESISAFSRLITSNPAASVFRCWNFAERDVGRFWRWDLKNALIDSCNAGYQYLTLRCHRCHMFVRPSGPLRPWEQFRPYQGWTIW